DSGRNAVPWVGGDRADLLAFGVEPQGEVLLTFHPEALIEALFQLLGLMIKPLCFIFAVEPPEYLGELQFGRVDESLLFAGGDRWIDLRAVVINNGIPGILPALVMISLI